MKSQISNRLTPRALALLPALASSLALSLVLAACRTAPPADDASLLTAVQTRIASDSALAKEPIQATVQNGVTTLIGSVSSDAARSLAANDAAQISGVRTVVNNLTITPQAAQSPLPPPPQPPPNALKPRPIPGPPAKAVTPKLAPKPAPPQQAQIAPPPIGAPPSGDSAPAPIERASTQSPPPLPAAPPAPPAFRTVTLPPDSTIPVRITQTLDSATTQQGDSFTGVVATDVIIDGLVALPQGTPITGRVSAVQEAAHYKGNSLLSIELTNINHRGEHISVSTEPYTREGAGRGKNTAEKVGGGAAVGAILGGILGGGKGAAIGAAAGGGVGAGANTVTRGQQVQIPSETLVQFRLTNSVALRASTRDPGTRDRDASSGNQQRRPLDSPPQ